MTAASPDEPAVSTSRSVPQPAALPGHTSQARPRRADSARQRARAEITAELLAAARDQLTQVGAGSLSLRAVAREVGMASSAIYRYFPSRDDLLTRLIIEAYDDIGTVAEGALGRTDAASPADQFRAVWRAVRQWAVAHPHQYALIFGSPVPGYAAPTDTIAPATRLPDVLLTILAAAGRGREDQPTSAAAPRPVDVALTPKATAAVAAALTPIRAAVPVSTADDAALLAAITSWAALLGAISFELFGHTHNVVEDAPGPRADFFDAQIELMLLMLGLHDGGSA